MIDSEIVSLVLQLVQWLFVVILGVLHRALTARVVDVEVSVSRAAPTEPGVVEPIQQPERLVAPAVLPR